VKKGAVKQKITIEYISSLYDKAKKLKSKEKKLKIFKEIRLLTKHIGSYIIKPLD
tara:strand:- start:521 stop:685 length:165 start_codon:yes stop_codon:yes gene_type:complete